MMGKRRKRAFKKKRESELKPFSGFITVAWPSLIISLACKEFERQFVAAVF
jgi:hypothetical protein